VKILQRNMPRSGIEGSHETVEIELRWDHAFPDNPGTQHFTIQYTACGKPAVSPVGESRSSSMGSMIRPHRRNGSRRCSVSRRIRDCGERWGKRPAQEEKYYPGDRPRLHRIFWKRRAGPESQRVSRDSEDGGQVGDDPAANAVRWRRRCDPGRTTKGSGCQTIAAWSFPPRRPS
jgi:hypothetical protein